MQARSKRGHLLNRGIANMTSDEHAAKKCVQHDKIKKPFA